jgi:hypothetical protein
MNDLSRPHYSSLPIRRISVLFGRLAPLFVLCGILLGTFFFVAAVSLCAQARPPQMSADAAAVRIVAERSQYWLGTAMAVIEDSASTFTLNDVQRLYQSAPQRFRSGFGETVNFSYTTSAYWLRCEVRIPQHAAHGSWMLVSRNFPATSVDVYVVILPYCPTNKAAIWCRWSNE